MHVVSESHLSRLKLCRLGRGRSKYTRLMLFKNSMTNCWSSSLPSSTPMDVSSSACISYNSVNHASSAYLLHTTSNYDTHIGIPTGLTIRQAQPRQFTTYLESTPTQTQRRYCVCVMHQRKVFLACVVDVCPGCLSEQTRPRHLKREKEKLEKKEIIPLNEGDALALAVENGPCTGKPHLTVARGATFMHGCGPCRTVTIEERGTRKGGRAL
jgi:hypothetical protein